MSISASPDVPAIARPRAIAGWPQARLLGGLPQRALLALLLPAGLLALWWWASTNNVVSQLILPPPSLVWSTLADMTLSGELPAELAVSLRRLALGLLVGGGLGVALGLLTGLSRTAEDYLGPLIRVLWLVPMLGWLPFLMLFLGLGEALKLAMIGKSCFLPLLVNTREGVLAIPRGYLEVGRVFELPRRLMLRLIVGPAVLLPVFTGLRFSISEGWKALIVVEMIASAAGIGYLMSWGRTLFQLDVVMATMVVIGLAGWALDFALSRVERRMTRWSLRSV